MVAPDEKAGKRKVTSISTARTLLFAATVRHIVAQVEAGWNPGKIAVLVRAKHEGVEIAELLREHRVPAVVSGLGNVMQSPELLELQVVLEAIATPRHEAGVRAAIATHLWGGEARDVLRLSQAGSEAQWDMLLSQFTGLRELWLTHGLLQVVQELMRRRAVTERFLQFEDGERRLTNLRHVIELLHAAASGGAGVVIFGVYIRSAFAVSLPLIVKLYSVPGAHSSCVTIVVTPFAFEICNGPSTGWFPAM